MVRLQPTPFFHPRNPGIFCKRKQLVTPLEALPVAHFPSSAYSLPWISLGLGIRYGLP